MNRRRFLAAVAPAGLLPGLLYANRPPQESIDVRYWLSERAARYDVPARLPGYLEAALSPVFDVDVSFGGVVPIRTEDGYDVTRSGEWPRQVVAGSFGTRGIDPTGDANLLVTDGSIRRGPTGLAMHHVASVAGARHLENLPPRADVDDVVPFTYPFLAVQVAIHEVGHLLGLAHDHGSIHRVEHGTAVSPMVSTYAWMSESDQFTARESACGEAYPLDRSGPRHLSLAFSACSRAELGTYRGGLVR